MRPLSRNDLLPLAFWLIALLTFTTYIREPEIENLQPTDLLQENDIPPPNLERSISAPQENKQKASHRDVPPPDPHLAPDPLIEKYGQNDQSRAGENGRGIIFVGDEQKKWEKHASKYQVNVFASDLISLNRWLPDSRHPSCRNLTYPVAGLPDVTVIIPFHDEWLSLLLRTVYSVINRTPPSLLREILLVDDASTLENLHGPLDTYINLHFHKELVRLIRLSERKGLIHARQTGWREAKGEILVFLDSHMEMNKDWLQPLLVEIQKNKKTIAMSVLDSIDAKTLQYNVRPDYLIRYGFNWRLSVFETKFRKDQIGSQFSSPRKGVTMIGTAFAVNKHYFTDLGAFDEGMKILGGENLELSWRVWLCGGQLLHVPCSHVGHVIRPQPYTFPGGRHEIEMYNYKRAVDVWMGPLKKYVYNSFPGMEAVDAGDISERLKLKDRLKCKGFDWFLDNIWPELLAYDRNVTAWGSVMNPRSGKCLDNYMRVSSGQVYLNKCHNGQNSQGFSLTKGGYLRTTLTYLVFNGNKTGETPALEPYQIGHQSTWSHKENTYLIHNQSQLCLDCVKGFVTMERCSFVSTQIWVFNHHE